MFGPDRLTQELRDLGYDVEEVEVSGARYAVLRAFTVPCGRFVGRTIDLGIQATSDFPRTVASAIHVLAKPQLFDYGDTQPGVRNITRSALGPEWRYWSHNFRWSGERTARRLISQINAVFCNA